MTARILVVCEAAADFRIASDLADRIALDRIDWLEPDILAYVRSWAGLSADASFLTWRDLDRAMRDLGVRVRPRSRFGEHPAAPDAKAADKALQLALLAGDFAAVVLVRDSDGDPTRRQGLTQARERDAGRAWPFAVLIGVAHAKREAWVLAGFVPRGRDEEGALARLSAELGFDPCERSHELTARMPGARREVKRTAAELIGDYWERQERCWRETDLDLLRRRGQENGLAAYLEEVETRLLPCLGAPRNPLEQS